MNPTSMSKKAQAERREAARIRKAKSRLTAKEFHMERIRLSMGFLDAKAIRLMAEKYVITQSKVVELLINRNVKDGKWDLAKPFVGICYESQPDEVDITIPADVAKHLHHYKETLTPGDLVSLMIGIELNPKWDVDEPMLVGTMPDGSPVRMASAREAAWQFKNHTYEGMVAMGHEKRAKKWWPNHKAQLKSLQAYELRAWSANKEQAKMPEQLTWHANNDKSVATAGTVVKSRECYPGEEAEPKNIMSIRRSTPMKPTWVYNHDTESCGWSHLMDEAA